MNHIKDADRPVRSDSKHAIIVGVTGHRNLPDRAQISKRVQEILDKILKRTQSKSSPLSLKVLSPLAEGADRLVAKEVLKHRKSELWVVLPMMKEEYLKDFETSESKREFEELLSKDEDYKVLPEAVSRNESYEQVGRFVVDNCDALIAIWDGEPSRGQGGTAEIVEYARSGNKPLFWISSKQPIRVTEENLQYLRLMDIQDDSEHRRGEKNDLS